MQMQLVAEENAGYIKGSVTWILIKVWDTKTLHSHQNHVHCSYYAMMLTSSNIALTLQFFLNCFGMLFEEVLISQL